MKRAWDMYVVFAAIRAEYEKEFCWNIYIFTAKSSMRKERSRIWNQTDLSLDSSAATYELYVLNLTELLLTVCKMKWFPMPQAVLRTKWDVYKEPKRTSLDKLAFWTAAHTVMIAHTMSNSSTLIASYLLAPPFSSEDLGVCLRKTWPQLQGYFLVCLRQSLWSHCPGHDLDVGAWSNSAPMR